ncbi:hypothetical protein BLNAU_18665 [Blattamonas nauphoetae]|uniref:Uncharacterized protein n=1 Tax=Blattamonas nauphoetae TaxID=2049346 RepID=A0ABQ9X3S6_9EUKA|nr:hypothetical protein BLNAU_18665 [Blattamonas nauphoetae]
MSIGDNTSLSCTRTDSSELLSTLSGIPNAFAHHELRIATSRLLLIKPAAKQQACSRCCCSTQSTPPCDCPDTTSTSASLCITSLANTSSLVRKNAVRPMNSTIFSIFGSNRSSTTDPSRCGVSVIFGTFSRRIDDRCGVIVRTGFGDVVCQSSTTSPDASSFSKVMGGSSKRRRKMSMEVSGLEAEMVTLV